MAATATPVKDRRVLVVADVAVEEAEDVAGEVSLRSSRPKRAPASAGTSKKHVQGILPAVATPVPPVQDRRVLVVADVAVEEAEDEAGDVSLRFSRPKRAPASAGTSKRHVREILPAMTTPVPPVQDRRVLVVANVAVEETEDVAGNVSMRSSRPRRARASAGTPKEHVREILLAMAAPATPATDRRVLVAADAVVEEVEDVADDVAAVPSPPDRHPREQSTDCSAGWPAEGGEGAVALG